MPFKCGKVTETWRRYSEFQKLFQFIRAQKNFIGIVIPELESSWLPADENTVLERKKTLESILNKLLARNVIRNLLEVRMFLLTDQIIQDFDNIGIWQKLKKYLPNDLSSITYTNFKTYLSNTNPEVSNAYQLANCNISTDLKRHIQILSAIASDLQKNIEI